MFKKICLYLLLFIPVLLSAMFTHIMYAISNVNNGTWLIIIIFYIITITGIVFYIKYKPFSAWWLPLGFAISPLPMYIEEYGSTGWFKYLGTYFVIYFYALPFIAISIIAAVVLLIIKKRKGMQ